MTNYLLPGLRDRQWNASFALVDGKFHREPTRIYTYIPSRTRAAYPVEQELRRENPATIQSHEK